MSKPPVRAGIFTRDQALPLRASIYTRVSKDARKGTIREAISTDSQAIGCQDVADDEGWKVVGPVYCDNDISASKYSKKVREDWPRLIADLEAGRFDIIIMWESSRGSRKLSEWSRFLETAAERGVLIHIVTHERTYDPRNERDWKTLATDGVDAEVESSRTSKRVGRLKNAARVAGRPDGRCPFGFQRNYDSKTGALLEQVHEPLQSAVVKEIFKRIDGGDSLVAVARDLNERAALPRDDPRWLVGLPSGARFRTQTVRRIATQAAHAGKIRHKSELFDAEWEQIVTFKQWHAVQTILSNPERKTTVRPGRVKFLLSGLILCARCGSKVVVVKSKANRGQLRYSCRGFRPDGTRSGRSGCVSAPFVPEVADFVLLSLARVFCVEDFVQSLSLTDDTERVAAQEKAAEMQANLDAMWERVAAMEPGFTAERAAALEAKWTPEIARLQEEATAGLDGAQSVAAELLTEAKRSGLAGSALETVMFRAVKKLPIPGQRELVKTFLPALILLPSVRRGAQYTPAAERIRYGVPQPVESAAPALRVVPEIGR